MLNRNRTLITTLAAIVTTALVATASAQVAPTVPNDAEDQQDGHPATEETTEGAPVNDGDLPRTQSDNDPHPEVASVGTPDSGLVEQAGVGGLIGYGRAGVLELGGAGGFAVGGGLTQLNISPSIGWFFTDNLEISAIVNVSYAKTDLGDGTIMSALLEPSYHLPFDRTKFAFLGLGFGPSYVKGPGLGLAFAPRVGGNFLIGRSGILTPSLSWQYSTHDTTDTAMGTLLVVSSAVRAQVGYTIMW